jgi:hypothetical protein
VENANIGATLSVESRHLTPFRILPVVAYLLIVLFTSLNTIQALQAMAPGADPVPEPAIPAILAAFDKYEVVAMDTVVNPGENATVIPWRLVFTASALAGPPSASSVR